MPALKQTEYAKLRGVTPSAICQAVKTDRIHLNEDGLIETADADAVYFPRKINASAELTMDVTASDVPMASAAMKGRRMRSRSMIGPINADALRLPSIIA